MAPTFNAAVAKGRTLHRARPSNLSLELQRSGQIAKLWLIVCLQRSVAFGKAGKDRQVEAAGDERRIELVS